MQVNKQNYREALIRHLEGELSAGERQMVESYIATHGDAAEEWRRLQRTRLQPDMKVAFPNKARLYRTEEPAETVATVRKLTPYPYLKYLSAIAAAIVFAALYFVLKPQSGAQELNGLAQEQQHITKPLPGNKGAEAATNSPKNKEWAAVEGGSTTKTPPDKKKDDKQRKQTPKKTIIIVNNPGNTPAPTTLAKASPLHAYDVKSVTIPVENKRLETTNIPASSLAMEPKTRIDFKAPEEDQDDEYVSTFSRAYQFITRNISLRKEKRSDESIYAFRLQTKNVSIYKTFKGF